MHTVAEAQARILDRITMLDALELSIADAHGCVLAETVTAPEDLPPHPTAAIDGFAIRAADTASAASQPASLTIIGEAAHGRPFAARVTHGEAVRISAGATIPEGADTVAVKDDVAVVGSSMAIGKALVTGDNVRPAGQDVARGDPVMQEGQRIRGMDVGVLAALGRARVSVRPRPRVVTFAAGDDTKEPNTFAIAGMSRETGSEPTRGGTHTADADVLREKFQALLPQADVFVTSGGLVSDDQPPILEAAAKLGDVQMWQIAARPEMSMAFGTVQGRPFFGLPDGPVAVSLAFELFVRPALLRMAGRRNLSRAEAEASMEDGFEQRPGKETYLRVRAWRDDSGWRARLAGRQGANVVSSVATANAIAVLPLDQGFVQPGDRARIILLEPLEGW